MHLTVKKAQTYEFEKKKGQKSAKKYYYVIEISVSFSVF